MGSSWVNWISAVLLVVVTLAQVAQWVDRWVHRREWRERELELAATGAPSLKSQLESAQREIVAMRDEVQRLHTAASDFNGKLTERIGRMDMDLKMELARIHDRELHDLKGRMQRMEEGNTEWLLTLRDRTHDVSEVVNAIILRITLHEKGITPDRPMDLFSFGHHPRRGGE